MDGWDGKVLRLAHSFLSLTCVSLVSLLSWPICVLSLSCLGPVFDSVFPKSASVPNGNKGSKQGVCALRSSEGLLP